MKTIVVQCELPKPPAIVWRALTEPALVVQWLMTTDIVPEVGREFSLLMPAQPNFDGVIRCKVKVAQAPTKLSYSWQSPDLDTVLSWELKETPVGTLLRLEHSGFDLGKAEQITRFKAFNIGWQKLVPELLLPVVETLS